VYFRNNPLFPSSAPRNANIPYSPQKKGGCGTVPPQLPLESTLAKVYQNK
jgi:hypothetical protein